MNELENRSGMDGDGVAQNSPADAGAASSHKLKFLAAGAALVAVPIAGVAGYIKLSQVSQAKAKEQEEGFQYKSDHLRQVDPALIKYELVGKIDTGMTVPRVIAMDGRGDLLVAGDRVVRIMSATGGVKKQIKLTDAPFAVCAAEDGSILVSLRNRIDVFDADGQKTGSWPLAADSYVTGIAVSGEHVYLADSGRRLIIHTDRSGKMINEIGKADPGRGIGGLVLPSPHLEVAAASNGTIWVNNAGRHQLENYSPDGTLEHYWGRQGTAIEAFPGCCNPTDFHLLPDGSFITTEKGVVRVKHYLADGRFDCVIAAPQSFGPNMIGLGVTVDMAGRVLVLERGTSVIHVFAKKDGSAS